MKNKHSGSINHVPQNRYLWIDSLRGAAMVLVLLQHSYLSVNRSLIPHALDLFIWGITFGAAAAFVSISGVMFSYFLYISPQWRSVYRHYATRAAFLILLVHPVINLMSCFFRMAGKGCAGTNISLLKFILLDFPITDTIGVCMLLAPVFIVQIGTIKRITAIVTMLILTVLIRAFVVSASPELLMLKEALFGSLGDPKLFWVSLVPWFSIFLTGSFLGQAMALLKQGALSISALIHRMKWVGLILIFLSLILTVGYKILKMMLGDMSPQLFIAIYPGQTTTLLPGYLGVITLLLAIIIYRIEILKKYDRFVWFLTIMGRTSLFCYVVQFAVVESIPALFGYKGILGFSGFLIFFVMGLIIMNYISYAYGRLRGWIQKDDYGKLAINIIKG